MSDREAMRAAREPEFAELKELPDLRRLAKMVTESPCFTNAILAVTDAYKFGWKAQTDRSFPGYREGKWVSVEERLPEEGWMGWVVKDETSLWRVTKDKGWVGGFRHGGGGVPGATAWWDGEGLPIPPKAEAPGYREAWNETKDKKWPDDEQGILAEIAYFVSDKPVTEIIACYIDGEDLKTLGGDDIGWTMEVILRWIPLPTPDDPPNSPRVEAPGYREMREALEAATEVVEFVRRNHNSRSDMLLELIAKYDRAALDKVRQEK